MNEVFNDICYKLELHQCEHVKVWASLLQTEMQSVRHCNFTPTVTHQSSAKTLWRFQEHTRQRTHSWMKEMLLAVCNSPTDPLNEGQTVCTVVPNRQWHVCTTAFKLSNQIIYSLWHLLRSPQSQTDTMLLSFCGSCTVRGSNVATSVCRLDDWSLSFALNHHCPKGVFSRLRFIFCCLDKEASKHQLIHLEMSEMYANMSWQHDGQ